MHICIHNRMSSIPALDLHRGLWALSSVAIAEPTPPLPPYAYVYVYVYAYTYAGRGGEWTQL